MAKIQIKSEKLTPFLVFFSIMEQFDALLAQTIDSSLGLRCTMFGYQYSEILRSLMCVYLCGGKERIFDDMNNGFWLESIAKIIHGTEYCIPAYDSSHQKLLQSYYAEIENP